jgi:hypothetical protein
VCRRSDDDRRRLPIGYDARVVVPADEEPGTTDRDSERRDHEHGSDPPEDDRSPRPMGVRMARTLLPGHQRRSLIDPKRARIRNPSTTS